MGSQQTFKPTPSLITIPQYYPDQPTPGKIEILWDANFQSLYRRFSPYVTYTTSLLGGFTSQPFYYTYADEGNKGLPGLRKYESRLFPIGSAPIDVIRVSRFLASANGIEFLGKQFLLQTSNPYNETRVYNPISPIVAAGMGLALGSIRPTRFLDISGGLLGIARSLIGNAIPDAIFGEPKVSKPFGTAPDALYGGPLNTTGGKGLIRAQDANRGRAHLEKAWPQQDTKGASLTRTFGSIVKNLVTSLFANFIPATQQGISQKSDEGAYGLMIGGGNPRFSYFGASNSPYGFGQRWIGGGVTIRKKGEYPDTAYKLFIKYSNNGQRIDFLADNNDISSGNIPGVGNVGYTVHESTDINSPGFRYGDVVGEEQSTRFGEEYTDSDIMFQYKEYVDPSQPFPTKDPDSKKVKKINDELVSVLALIKNANEGTLYNVNVPTDATVIRSGNAQTYGYDRLFKTNQKGSPVNYPLGVLQDYRNVPVVDQELAIGQQRSYHLPTNGRFDSINTLTVIPQKALGSKNPLNPDKEWSNLHLVGWGTKQWEPYKDDLVAFYFYDVVNENYVPFRAAIKSLAETGNASWEEMPFIGRGDKLYSYGGFNRNVNFSFHIVISSIAELAPTWQRINYLTTLIKPANYTTDDLNQVTNRFMVPPMVMLTIGDMYRDQPVLIQSIATSVPDDAAWEVLNENNVENGVDWSYLASYITAPNILFGQLPREVEISLNLILLEKERAIVGGANFGHAPRKDNGEGWNTNTVPNGGSPNKLNSSLVVNVFKAKSAPTLPTSKTPSQQPIPSESPKTQDLPTLNPQPQPTPPPVEPSKPPIKRYNGQGIIFPGSVT